MLDVMFSKNTIPLAPWLVRQDTKIINTWTGIQLKEKRLYYVQKELK